MKAVKTLTELYNVFREEHGTRGRALSHRAAAALAGDAGKYETFRLIGAGRHSGRIDEETVAALIRLGLDERDVRTAAGHQMVQSPGPFALPDRANRLTLPQREVVLAVVDTILAAAEGRTPDDAAVQAKRAEGRAMLDRLPGEAEPSRGGRNRRRSDLT